MFGMDLHWGKFQLMCVKCDVQVVAPGGAAIVAKECMKYLGATLYITGALGGGLTTRLGMAWG
eukprot:1043075-Pyramimonas_sp.AAC.1